MDGWLVFFVLLLAYGALVFYAARRNKPLPWGFELNGPFLMWRTQFGKRALERIARPRAFWNIIADGGIILTFAMGALIFLFLAFLFVLQLRAFFVAPDLVAANAQSPNLLVGIPGVNPLIPLGYGFVAIILALVIHEGSHGVMSYASRMRVKSLGLLMFIVPVGAFVEPDEEDLEKSTTREKNRVFAAGPTSNIVLAIVAGSILSLAFMGSLAVANDGKGVVLATVEPGSGAEEALLQRGDILTAIDGKRVDSTTDYRDALNNTAAGQQIGIDYLRDGKAFHAEAVLGDRYAYLQKVAPAQATEDQKGKGFLGVSGVGLSLVDAEKDVFQHPFGSVSNFLTYNLYPLYIFQNALVDIFSSPFSGLFIIHGPLAVLPAPFFFGMAGVLYWTVWINITLATFNSLPMGPLDGGQMFRATLRERLMQRYKVDRAQVHVERAEMGGMRLSGRDEETQGKLDRIQVVVKRTTWTLGFGILGLIVIPIIVPHVLRIFF